MRRQDDLGHRQGGVQGGAEDVLARGGQGGVQGDVALPGGRGGEEVRRQDDLGDSQRGVQGGLLPGGGGGPVKGAQLGRREGSGLTARYSKGINAYQPVLPELARICMAKKKQAGSLVCTLCTWVVNKITKKNTFLYHKHKLCGLNCCLSIILGNFFS